MEWWIIYLLMGLFVGFFAGMLGVGGGLILVTLMVFLFSLQGFPADRVVHVALGTSLTSIVFTSLSSLRAHHSHGAVRWDIVKMATPGLVVGTLLGTFVADRLALQKLVANPTIDLTARIPHGSGQTYLRELVLVADHTAYHVGQLVLVRQQLGIWNRG